MFRNEEGFSLVELAVAAGVAVTIGAVAITASTGTSAVISSKASVGKNVAETYNSSVVLNPDAAIAAGQTFINLVDNSDFGASIAGWEGVGNTSRDTSVFRSAPASLNTYYDGDNIPYATYSRNSVLTVGQRYSLSFWIKNSVTRNFLIYFAGNRQASVSIPGSSSWQYIKVENVAADNAYMAITVFPLWEANGLYSVPFNIDDVTVVKGATAQ